MVKVFLDTDIGPDCDDAGALQVLHTLCAQGRAQLLGVTHCTSNPHGLPAVSVINRYNGREVPLGTTRREGFLTDGDKYNRALDEQYDHEFKDGREQRDAREVFAEVLAAQDDHSVTVVAIGPLNNIADYIATEEGRALVRQKVRRLVCMAGRFDGLKPEWNVEMDVSAARSVLENWPTPIVFCGWEAGGSVITGAALEGMAGHPVREAYRLYTNGSLRRQSWDLLTVLYAVLGDCDWIHAGEDGVISVQDDGATVFKACAGGRHSYTVNGVSNEKLAGYLNALL